tara:strand:- start:1864 stop:2412 length:549 start_codon:yes stop_codon:yes gene_type:complete
MALLQDKLLFTKADIAKAREISANITDAKIEPYIRETQSLNVRSFLGDQLYLLLLNDYTVLSNTFASQRFTDLWFGSDYTNRSGVTVRQNGLKIAAIYFCYGQFILQQNTNVGRYGVGSLNQDATETSGTSTVRTKKNQSDSIALNYQAAVSTFLNDKSTTYPEWQTKTTNGQKISAPFFKV